mgnify:CR=1 FL=1
MGHLLSTKSSLVPLIDRLNRYPVGLVDSAKLRELLGLLFDEREKVYCGAVWVVSQAPSGCCGWRCPERTAATRWPSTHRPSSPTCLRAPGS